MLTLDGPSMRTTHLGLDGPTSPGASDQPARISGIQAPEFPEPTVVLGELGLSHRQALHAIIERVWERVRQELHDRQRRDRLAGAALPHQRHRLPALDDEGDVADGTHLAAGSVEGDGEIADVEEGLGHWGVLRGSKASRTASPTKIRRLSMTASTKNPVSPSHGAGRFDFPCERISPREGEPGGSPKPGSETHLTLPTIYTV